MSDAQDDAQEREPREPGAPEGGAPAAALTTPKKKVRLTLSPKAEKYVRRDAPVEMRRMAAAGALPLEPIELVSVLFALLHDPDSEVKERARASLDELPDVICNTVLTGPTNPVVLSYLAQSNRENEERCEKLALNAAVDDETITFLATLPHRRVVDVISNNQERMIRCEEIVEALGSNPLTGRAVIDRILNFLGESPTAEGADDDMRRAEELNEQDAENALRALLGDDLGDLAKQLVSESEDGQIDQGSLFAVIQKMTVMQKIKLARLGGKEARSLLIRDRNKIVSTSVIQSPKITEQEVVGIAQLRSVSDEILRQISVNREWTRNYQVKQALATNPKSPQATALQFLNYLQDKDLKMVMKSREVPSAVSTHARRILQKKGKL